MKLRGSLDGLPVLDANAGLTLRVIPVDKARVHLSRVYVLSEDGTHWVRYQMSFDRGGTFEPGTYYFPPPHETENVRRQVAAARAANQAAAMTTDAEMTKDLKEVHDDMIEALAWACAKHEGKPDAAFIRALAAIAAKTIDLYVADNTPEGRDELLGYFISAIKGCLEQQHPKDHSPQ